MSQQRAADAAAGIIWLRPIGVGDLTQCAAEKVIRLDVRSCLVGWWAAAAAQVGELVLGAQGCGRC